MFFTSLYFLLSRTFTYRFLNEAALLHKSKHCDENEIINLSKELYLHDLPE